MFLDMASKVQFKIYHDKEMTCRVWSELHNFTRV
jgi:hypothetical protein